MAVEGWVGHQGEGKSYCLVAHCVEATLAGKTVFSNLDIRGCRHFGTWDELMAVLEEASDIDKRIVVGIDEAGKFLTSRFWQKADPRLLTLLQERRKIARGVDLCFTVPSWRMVETHLRDITQRVRVCKRIGGHEYSHDGGRPPLAFLERWHWPDDLTTERMGPRKRARPHRRRFLAFTPQLASLYDTGVLDMSQPMAERVLARPDYYNAASATTLK